MKLPQILFRLALLLLTMSTAQCGGKPVLSGFNGSWVMDKEKGFNNGPGFDQMMTITQTGDQIKIIGKEITQQGEQPINESFTLNGKEIVFTPAGQTPNATGKRTANWLPDKHGFFVTEQVFSNGELTLQTTRKWLLSPDGSTLTMDRFVDAPKSLSFEAKLVFVTKP